MTNKPNENLTNEVNDVLNSAEQTAKNAAVSETKAEPAPQKPSENSALPHTYGDKDKKMKKSTKVWLIIIAVILCLCILFGTIFAILVAKGKKSLLNHDNNFQINGDNIVTTDEGKIVTYNGKTYVINEDITSVLVMGIDKLYNGSDSGTYGQMGQADALFILAMDTKTGKSTIIPVVRDAMAEVDVYSGDGNFIATEKKQICLAYAYGNNAKSCCENVVKSVSRLFYGLPINSYAAIDLNAVPVMANMVGGVEVEALESMKLSTQTVTKGQRVLLKGQDARMYLQERDKSIDDSSLDRSSRHQQFLMAFSQKAMAQTKSNLTFPVKMYNSVSKSMHTNVTISKLSYIASRLVAGADFLVELKRCNGSMNVQNEYAEYYLDENSVYQTILDVFYKEQA